MSDEDYATDLRINIDLYLLPTYNFLHFAKKNRVKSNL